MHKIFLNTLQTNWHNNCILAIHKLQHVRRVEMAGIRPENLVLRCYGYKIGDNPFVGVCVDLNIAVQASSEIELKKKMNGAIKSYIETALDTEDKSSIPLLIERRAPIRDWVIYYLVKALVKIRQIPTNFTFKEYIPFQLANNC